MGHWIVSRVVIGMDPYHTTYQTLPVKIVSFKPIWSTLGSATFVFMTHPKLRRLAAHEQAGHLTGSVLVCL